MRDGVADGIAAVQHQVRENIKYGADLIKICATGGVLSKGDDPQASQFTLEEMQAMVADAHRLGRKVAAHAHGAQGILWASEAGVDSIEHGSYIDDERFAAMKQNGTYLVPTLYLDRLDARVRPPAAVLQQKMMDVSAVAKKNSRKHAYESGVKIALGTDAAVYPHGLNAHEVEVYVPTGHDAAGRAADGDGECSRFDGLVRPRRRARAGQMGRCDCRRRRPAEDVRTLQHVKFVMKAGVVYKQ